MWARIWDKLDDLVVGAPTVCDGGKRLVWNGLELRHQKAHTTRKALARASEEDARRIAGNADADTWARAGAATDEDGRVGQQAAVRAVADRAAWALRYVADVTIRAKEARGEAEWRDVEPNLAKSLRTGRDKSFWRAARTVARPHLLAPVGH